MTYVGPVDMTLIKDSTTNREILRVRSFWNMTQEREEGEEGVNMQLKPGVIFLTDNKGNSREYNFVLSVLKPEDFNATFWEEKLIEKEEELKPAVNITEEIRTMLEKAFAELTEKPDKKPPSARIQGIEVDGVVDISFNATMFNGFGVEEINDSIDPGDGFPISEQLNVEVRAGALSDASKLGFSWNVTEYNFSSMKIQLVFDNANYVSSQDEPDILVITFVNRKLFFDSGGEFLVTYELRKAIKRQLPKNR